jgi:Flp pilus assembly protein CpaB
MVLAAVLAFTVNLVVLRSRDDTTPVAAVRTGVVAGEVVDSADIRLVEVDVDADILSSLFQANEVQQLVGMVATRQLVPGELLNRSALIPAAGAGGLRAMSVPIDPAHAVGGDLVAGDRIDLIHVTEAGPQYVLVGAEVLSVATPDGAALTGSTGFYVVIAVTEASALEVAAAINDGKIELVRSTGAASTSHTEEAP